MNIKIISSHPSVTIVESDDKRFELPTGLFNEQPQPGQIWQADVRHQLSYPEQVGLLNGFLARD